MDVKKICFAIVAVLLIMVGVSVMKDKGIVVDKTKADYEAIEAVHKEMESLKSTSLFSKAGPDGQWNVFELGLMYEKEDDFFKRVRKDLGEDFQWKLSNGDSIFIGVMPHLKKYRIYAGTPDEGHMLYPDWNYTKIEKK